MNLRLYALLSALLWLFALPCRAQQQARAIAITIDDLPSTDNLPRNLSPADVARNIIQALQQAHVPTPYGFVNAQQADGSTTDLAILKMWREAGFPLGNHTYLHSDLNKEDVAAFERDIARDEPVLHSLSPDADWHWFRYPYLCKGDTAAKRDAIEQYLAANGYREAHVTINFDDWRWNNAYARCTNRHNQTALAMLHSTYLAKAQAAIDRSQKQSQAFFGRQIPQVMLLHIGGIESLMLPQLLQLLKKDGYQFIPLAQAEDDPAYKAEPDHPLPGGATLLQEFDLDRGGSDSPHPDPDVLKVQNACRWW